MYDEYPVAYESTFNNNILLLIIVPTIMISILLLTLISLSKVYKKANRSKISAFIPIYNMFVLLEITNLPKYYFILLLVPVVNIIIYVKIMFTLAKLFRKSELFGLGLVILPFVFFPILAFGNNEFIGINLIAKTEESVVVDIPQIDTKEEKEIVVNEEFDEQNRNINISIGGGVYQKEYTSTLLKTDKTQNIEKKPDLINPYIITPVNNVFIKHQEEIEEEKPEVKQEVSSFEMPNIIQNTNQSIGKEEQVNNNSEYKICPKCKTKLKNGIDTCFMCGTKVN